MKRLSVLGLSVLFLGGCANLPGAGPTVGQSCDEHLSQAQQLQLDMARDMLKDGRLHAALANLETMPPQLLDVRESKAVALRRIGSPKAKALYQGLLDSCKAGEAHHGLGQIALRDGHLAEAEREMREAARLQPTDGLIRNDLGVVLLRKGDREGARFEFLTAVELNEGDKLPATNLLSLLFLEGEDSQAAALIDKAHLSDDQVRQAHSRADALRPGAPKHPVAAEGVVQVEAQPARPLPPALVKDAEAEARDAGLLVKAH
ncbi:tetratricopeptide repeat protein [Pseudomonas knackmussii]|uniref:tetratricopeptide repeat protein n=1 Tax=Pseudomonas knackmussii TaxID=65741 RepID=UPI003F4A0E77